MKTKKSALVCSNGKFVRQQDAKISVFDRGLLYGDGVFDTIPTAHGKIFWLEEHIKRLLRGCNKLKINMPWPQEKLINLVNLTYLKNHHTPFEKIKIIITRGISTKHANIENIESCKANLIIYCIENVLPTQKQYQQGVKLITIQASRSFPEIKSLSYIVSVIGQLKAKEKGYYDALFTDQQGHVLEGTSFNIAAVKNNQVIISHHGALPGVTSQKVIKLAKKLGHTIQKTPITLGEIPHMDEIFVTGSTKRILPVIQINHQKIAAGKPGPLTKKLLQEFRKQYF